MTSGIRLCSVRGVPIRAHWSWLLVTVALVWSLAGAVLPVIRPGLGGDVHLVMGVLTAALGFGSMLLREAARASVAARTGLELREIILWPFGGVVRLRWPPAATGAALGPAVAPPVVSLLLAVLCGAVNGAAGLPAEVTGVAGPLAVINLLPAAGGLVPVLPLDGGRVLRALLGRGPDGFLRVTRWTAGAGRAAGFTLVLLGLLSFFAGHGLAGFWAVLLGWFLTQAAQAEADDVLARRSLPGLRVRDAMRPDPVTVSPEVTVDRFLEIAARARFSAFPVTEQGAPRGLMTVRQAAAVPPHLREHRRVADVMRSMAEVPVVAPDDDLAEALDVLGDDGRRAVVVAGGRVVGVLTASDLARALAEAEGRAEWARFRRWSTALIVALAVLPLLVIGALTYRPPLLVMAPGPTFDVAQDVTVRGRQVTPVTGRYLATSVTLHRPNVFGAFVAGLDPDQEVLPMSTVIPADVPPERYLDRQRKLYMESRQMAAAAAARAVGLEVRIGGSGVEVTGVLPDTPAAGVLRPGDVIVRADGHPVEHVWRLQELVAARPVGTEIPLTVERQGARHEVRVRSVDLPEVAQGSGLGILGQTRDLRVDLPFEVSFTDREVAGPSAGLAYALAVADLLADEDYAAGRDVAATGTIRLDGSVGAVGGVRQKAIGAQRAGADLFIVPAAEVGQAAGVDPDLTVRGTETLTQALTLLSERA